MTAAVSMPSLFVSHGAPTITLDPSPARAFLQKFADAAPTPRAIVVASAHWETEAPAVGIAAHPETIHDFYGFPKALYDIRYPAPGAVDVAAQAAALIDAAGLGPVAKAERGLDHGAWVPLLLGYPQADIPVTQLSVQPHLGPAHHLALGRALRPLKDQGVLILGSGSITHNLAEFRGRAVDAPAPDWVSAFDAWISWAIVEGRWDDLMRYRTKAPDAVRNHPSEEHLLPLFVALGAGGTDAPARHLHKSYTHGILAMDAYAFG